MIANNANHYRYLHMYKAFICMAEYNSCFQRYLCTHKILKAMPFNHNHLSYPKPFPSVFKDLHTMFSQDRASLAFFDLSYR